MVLDGKVDATKGIKLINHSILAHAFKKALGLLLIDFEDYMKEHYSSWLRQLSLRILLRKTLVSRLHLLLTPFEKTSVRGEQRERSELGATNR